jgi:ATP-dependent DNA helicase RecQ
MIGYCKTTRCLRGYLLDYFGQTHESLCRNCGNCMAAFVMTDITPQAQMILSCMKRVRDKLGYNVGAALIARVLHGSTDKRVLELGLDKLTTYGLMKNVARPQIREYIDFLNSGGYIDINPEYSSLGLTERSASVLFQGKRVEIPVKSAALAGYSKERDPKRARQNSVDESDLLTVLKGVRTRLAQEEGVPAYIIFSNASLADMAGKMPHTLSEFMDVSGVGEVRASRYGQAFLEAISAYERGERLH